MYVKFCYFFTNHDTKYLIILISFKASQAIHLENNGTSISLSNNQVINSNHNQIMNNMSNSILSHGQNLISFSNAPLSMSNTNINSNTTVNATIQQGLLHPNISSSLYQHQSALVQLNNLLSHHRQQQHLNQPIIHIPSLVSYPINGREQIVINPRVAIPRFHFFDRSLEVFSIC